MSVREITSEDGGADSFAKNEQPHDAESLARRILRHLQTVISRFHSNLHTKFEEQPQHVELHHRKQNLRQIHLHPERERTIMASQQQSDSVHLHDSPRHSHEIRPSRSGLVGSITEAACWLRDSILGHSSSAKSTSRQQKSAAAAGELSENVATGTHATANIPAAADFDATQVPKQIQDQHSAEQHGTKEDLRRFAEHAFSPELMGEDAVIL